MITQCLYLLTLTVGSILFVGEPENSVSVFGIMFYVWSFVLYIIYLHKWLISAIDIKQCFWPTII